MAKKEHKNEFLGVGSIVQLIGVIISIVFFPMGILAGIILLIIGNRMSNKIVCSECRQSVDPKAKVCPHCQAQYQPKPT